ncbi:MAG: hypothetical protein WCF13_02485, partial [Stellaceae bacterium]
PVCVANAFVSLLLRGVYSSRPKRHVKTIRWNVCRFFEQSGQIPDLIFGGPMPSILMNKLMHKFRGYRHRLHAAVSTR